MATHHQITLHRSRLLRQSPDETRRVLRVTSLDVHNAKVHQARTEAAARAMVKAQQEAGAPKSGPGRVVPFPGKGRR